MTSVAIFVEASAIDTVVCGACTVAFQMEGSRVTPLKVMLFVPPKIVLPVPVVPPTLSRKVTLFETANAPPETTVVLFARVTRPVPSGPLVTVVGVPGVPLKVFGALLALMERPPLLMRRPPEKVFWPLSWSTPSPVLVMRPVPEMAPAMFTAGLIALITWLPIFGALILKVAAPGRLMNPLMVGVVPTLFETTVRAVALLRVRMPSVLTVGFETPPELLKLRAFSVLAPTSWSVELSFRVTVFAAAIWPGLVAMLSVAPLSVTPPAGMTTPLPIRFTVP